MGDITKDINVQNLANQTIKRFGKLDILVNNAGVVSLKPFLHPSAMTEYDRIMNTNLRAVYYLTHLLAPHLIKSKGTIINVSSIGGLRPV